MHTSHAALVVVERNENAMAALAPRARTHSRPRRYWLSRQQSASETEVAYPLWVNSSAVEPCGAFVIGADGLRSQVELRGFDGALVPTMLVIWRNGDADARSPHTPPNSVEQVSLPQPDSTDDVFDVTAREAAKQHSVFARLDAQTGASIAVGGTFGSVAPGADTTRLTPSGDKGIEHALKGTHERPSSSSAGTPKTRAN
jgi:hypothetical protein